MQGTHQARCTNPMAIYKTGFWMIICLHKDPWVGWRYIPTQDSQPVPYWIWNKIPSSCHSVQSPTWAGPWLSRDLPPVSAPLTVPPSSLLPLKWKCIFLPQGLCMCAPSAWDTLSPDSYMTPLIWLLTPLHVTLPKSLVLTDLSKIEPCLLMCLQFYRQHSSLCGVIFTSVYYLCHCNKGLARAGI